MNWEIIGATGEWAGAIAVFVTLVYLAKQMSQNPRALKSQSRRQVLEGIASDTQRYIETGGVELFSKASKGALSDEEAATVSFLGLTFMSSLEIQYHELIDETLDKEFEATLQYRLFTFLDSNGLESWETIRNFLTPAFQNYVDDQIAGGILDEFPVFSPPGHQLHDADSED